MIVDFKDNIHILHDVDEWNNADIRDLFESEGIRLGEEYHSYIVYVDGYRIVGCLAIAATDEFRPVIEFSIVVDQDYRRRGIARQLMAAFIEYSAELAAEFMWNSLLLTAYVVNNECIDPLLVGFNFCESEDNPVYWELEILFEHGQVVHTGEKSLIH